MTDEKRINTGHYHEVMDRSWLITRQWEEFIETTAVMEECPELAEAAAKIGEALGAFYQAAGRAFHERDEAETLVTTVRDLAIRWLPGTRFGSQRPSWRHAEDVAKLLASMPLAEGPSKTTVIAIGWGHDLIEDGVTEEGVSVTPEILRKNGVPDQVVRDIVTLSKVKDQPLSAYIDEVRFAAPHVRMIKCCDRVCNLTEGFNTLPPERWFRYVAETLDWILPMAKGLPDSLVRDELVRQLEQLTSRL